jgi:hypothetical protein
MNYYIPSSGVVLTSLQLNTTYGFNPESTSIEVLNLSGIYPILYPVTSYANYLYDVSTTYTIAGAYAEANEVATPLPLSLAKQNASEYVKGTSNEEATALLESSGVSLDIWAGAASQPAVSRPPVYNALLGAMADIGDSLAAQLTAIDSAATVDEINNIVNPPSGIFNTGRGLAGSEDMNPSYFVELNSVSLTPIDMEIYVPGTMTVIPYDSFLPPPYTFDSLGDCFNPGDYVIQIRIAATSEVIAEFEVPLNEYNEDVSF